MGPKLLIIICSKFMKSVILIKLGGSLITNKSKKDSINKRNLSILSKQIKKAQDLKYNLIIAHGQGSFAHIPARKYRTDKGIINKNSPKGICEVAGKASQLNRIVVDYLNNKGIKSFSINPSSIITTQNHQLNKIFTDSIEQLLKNNLIPVLYGDQILDKKIGCTIFSAEKVLNSIVLELKKKNYKIKKIIHCTNTGGVLDNDKKIIIKINLKNFQKYKKDIRGSKDIDVTGGMFHKVEESLNITKQGIDSSIIDGRKENNLLKAIQNKKFTGTKITK